MMVQENSSDTPHRGMPAHSKQSNERIPDDIYSAMSKLIYRKQSNHQKRENVMKIY